MHAHVCIHLYIPVKPGNIIGHSMNITFDYNVPSNGLNYYDSIFKYIPNGINTVGYLYLNATLPFVEPPRYGWG